MNSHVRGVGKQGRGYLRILGRCEDGQNGEFIEEISTDFCCDRSKNEACADQREWFIIDIKEQQDMLKAKESAQEANDVAGKVIFYLLIAVFGVCCPICLIILVVNYYLKRRNGKTNTKSEFSKRDFEIGQNYASSESDNEGNNQRRNRRP